MEEKIKEKERREEKRSTSGCNCRGGVLERGEAKEVREREEEEVKEVEAREGETGRLDGLEMPRKSSS